MSDKVKKILVLVINTIVAVVLGLADIYGFTIEWYGAVVAILVIVLDTWVGIEWIPPKHPKE